MLRVGVVYVCQHNPSEEMVGYELRSSAGVGRRIVGDNKRNLNWDRVSENLDCPMHSSALFLFPVIESHYK